MKRIIDYSLIPKDLSKIRKLQISCLRCGKRGTIEFSDTIQPKYMNIKEILGKDYLNKFEVTIWPTLFAPVWDNLKEERCIFCGNKLKFMRKQPLAICSSNKHGKPFIITRSKLNEIKQKC